MRATAAKEWVENDHEQSFNDRVHRVELIRALYEEELGGYEHVGFSGGLKAQSLFEEARCSFVYGQFFAAIVLGVSFIETALGAELYASGVNNVPSLVELIELERDSGWISEEEFEALNQARRVRNLVVHHDPPGSPRSFEARSLREGRNVFSIVEDDAVLVIRLMFRCLSRGLFTV